MVDTIQSLWEDLREGLFLRKRDFERELYSSCENFGEPLLFTKEEALY